MCFDYSKLRGKIKEIYGTQEKFATAIGIGRVSLNQRLNNSAEFKQAEIQKSCELLEIPKEEIAKYFFATNVQKHEQIKLNKLEEEKWTRV